MWILTGEKSELVDTETVEFHGKTAPLWTIVRVLGYITLIGERTEPVLEPNKFVAAVLILPLDTAINKYFSQI